MFSTMNNDFSDIAYDTLINPSSPLYATLMSIKQGSAVVISGRLFDDDTDCFSEMSLTMGGSIDAPDYVMRFSSVKLAQ